MTTRCERAERAATTSCSGTWTRGRDTTIVADGGDEVAVLFTGRTPELWYQPVAVVSWDRVRDLVGQIGQIEESFGPLVGFHWCCGVPRHRYEP